MKNFLTTLLFTLFLVPLMWAQNTISGTVIDGDGVPLIGVNILETGTSNGTVTDFDGNYEITVSDGATLTFSYTGYEPQEVAYSGNNTIDITMAEGVNLEEVVVTALGLSRKEKTLTYAQQSVDSDELMKTRDANFVNGLNGKTAGVEIKKSSSGAGGSTKVVLRGNKSLNDASSPLIVIDGIPMANNRGDQPGIWGGTDGGDGLSAINPDDIESVSILRGANAAVLYGSQGANGVVLITTKSGQANKTTVTVNSSLTFENYIELPDFQYRYGAVNGAKESWDATPGNYASGYIEDFFSTGVNFFNTISISGGNDKTQAYFSYGNINADGITPQNEYLKHNFTFKQSTKLIQDKLKLTSNVNVILENTDNRLPAGYYLNPLTGLYLFPRERDFNDFATNYEFFDATRNITSMNWFINDHHQSNPYWIINREKRTSNRKRAIASLTADYKLADNLSLQVRGNVDFATVVNEQQHYATSNTTNVGPNGAWDFHEYEDLLLYTDAILSYNEDLSPDFSLNAVLGASYQKTDYGNGTKVNTGAEILKFPNEFYFQNVPANVLIESVTNGTIEKQGVFAQATLGYRNMLYLDLSGRNDWSSTLALTGNESYFYPAIGLTALVHEMTDLPAAISFAKLRGSYTQVANDVPFNKIAPQNEINASGGVDRNTTRPFDNAEPEIITSWELGADMRFLNNRLGFDFTYYDITSTDQFVEVDVVSAEGGFTKEFINAGKITNNGIELTLFATPFKSKDIDWTTSFNITRNVSEVVDIGPDDERIINLGSSEGYFLRLVEGGRFNDLWVRKFQRDDQGRILFEQDQSTGKFRPLKTADPELIGNIDPDFSIGWNNTVNYKNFSFSALINGRFGGEVFSQTQSLLDGFGVSQVTGDARDAGEVVVNGWDQTNDAELTSINPEDWYRAIGDRNGVGEAYVYDRTNIKLSQLSIGYSLDVTKYQFLNAARVSLVGNNLFFFYKDAPFDPELAMNTGRNAQGVDNFNLPSTRTYGVNLNLTF